MRTNHKNQLLKDNQIEESHKRVVDYWIKNQSEKRLYDFYWLIDHFWPLPTKNNHNARDMYYWPEKW